MHQTARAHEIGVRAAGDARAFGRPQRLLATPKMKNTYSSTLASTTVMIVTLLTWGCDREAAQSATTSSAAQMPSSPQRSTNDNERRKADDDLKATVRRQHADWSDQQLNDYVKGYNGVGRMSPEAYAKTRAVLDSAKSLRCQFPSGSYIDLADPKLGRQEGAGVDVTFDSIDRQRGHARIIATTGAGDATVITGPTALTFVEVSATGNPLVTVVFPRFRAGTREFYAADSDHIFAFGDISIGQHYGSCAVLE